MQGVALLGMSQNEVTFLVFKVPLLGDKKGHQHQVVTSTSTPNHTYHGFNRKQSKLKWDVLNQPQEIRHGSLFGDSQDLCKKGFATVPLMLPSCGRTRNKEVHLEHIVRHPCRQAGWDRMEKQYVKHKTQIEI